jgi:bla regulator protein BlaR1
VLSLSAVATHAWQSTLFIAVVWLATLALRRNRARVRCWLWVAASVKFLVPVSVLVGLGARFEWETAPAIAQPAAAFVMDELLAPPLLTTVVAAPGARETSLVPWVLGGVWAAGCLVVLLRWWRDWMPIRAARRAATPLSLGADFDTTGLRVLSSSSSFEPGVVGVWRPVLLVPGRLLDRLTPPQLRALLAHERCHVRSHDNLFAAMHMVVEAVFWFHPLVWWIERRLIDERERACDEAVLDAGSSPVDYAEGILTVCRWSFASPVMCVSGVSGSDLRRRIETIMTSCIGHRLSATRRLLIVTAAIIVVVGPIGLGLLGASVTAQSPGEPPPRFEVASIKRTPLDTGPGADFRDEAGGRLRARNNSVANLIGNAYDFPQVRMVGGPEWIRSERYDLEAKALGEPSGRQMMVMLQTLLAERFKLRVHRETRPGPVYFLRVAGGGPKLQRSKADCVEVDRAKPAGPIPPPGAPRPIGCGNNNLSTRGATPPNIRWTANHVPMATIADSLGTYTRRTVIDKTGVTGFFDISMELPPIQPGAGVNDPAPIDAGPAPFTVLREQLGLILESGTGPLEYLVIDSVERPSEN